MGETSTSKYVDAAIKHGQSIEKGSARMANRSHDVIVREYSRLKREGRLVPELLPLLRHENADVRCWASTHLIEDVPDAAEQTLEHVASGVGLTAFSARMVLEEWRAGRLRLAEWRLPGRWGSIAVSPPSGRSKGRSTSAVTDHSRGARTSAGSRGAARGRRRPRDGRGPRRPASR